MRKISAYVQFTASSLYFVAVIFVMKSFARPIPAQSSNLSPRSSFCCDMLRVAIYLCSCLVSALGFNVIPICYLAQCMTGSREPLNISFP